MYLQNQIIVSKIFCSLDGVDEYVKAMVRIGGKGNGRMEGRQVLRKRERNSVRI